MKNVLIIASDFPPVGGVSTQRTLKFVKYLHCFGWNPIVLTIKNDRYTKIFMPVDTSLCSEIPKNAKIYAVSSYYWLWPLLPLLYAVGKELEGNKFYKFLGAIRIYKCIIWILRCLIVPEPLVVWYPFAIRNGYNIIKRHDIHMLYSTSPGPVAHLIAMKLATKYNIPWVADFRDPWAYASWTYKVRPMKLLDMRLEKKVLARADRLIITLPKLINEFKTIEKKFNPARCSLILNGYDEEDFKYISPHIFEQFTIVYTGRLKHPRRSPHHLFDVLSSLFQEFPSLKSKIRVVFIGRISFSVTRLVKECKLEDCVEMKGHLEHKKALSYICGASVLFLLAVETKGTGKPFQGKDVISLKLFEYLRAKRPILALVPEDSDSARIVQDTRSGVVVEPTDYQKAKKVILDMYEKYREGELKLRSNDSLIQKYERKVLTERLVEIFDDLLLKRERLKGAIK